MAPTTRHLSGKSNTVRQWTQLYSRVCLHLVFIFLLLHQCASPVAAQESIRIYLPEKFNFGVPTARKVMDSIYENYKVEIDICQKTNREYFEAPLKSFVFRVNGGELATLRGIDDGEQRWFHSPTQVGTYWVLGGTNDAIRIAGYDDGDQLYIKGQGLPFPGKLYADSYGFAYPISTVTRLASRKGYWLVDPCVLDDEINPLSVVLVDEPRNLTNLKGPWEGDRFLSEGAPLLTRNWELPEDPLDLEKHNKANDPFLCKPDGITIPPSLRALTKYRTETWNSTLGQPITRANPTKKVIKDAAKKLIRNL